MTNRTRLTMAVAGLCLSSATAFARASRMQVTEALSLGELVPNAILGIVMVAMALLLAREMRKNGIPQAAAFADQLANLEKTHADRVKALEAVNAVQATEIAALRDRVLVMETETRLRAADTGRYAPAPTGGGGGGPKS